MVVVHWLSCTENKYRQTTDTEWLKNLRRELLSTGVNISLTESESVSVLKKDIDAIVREIKGG